MRYEYDYLGREIAVVHPDGTRIEKHLTLNGWVRSIPGVLSEVTYDPRGLPTKMSYANGVVTDITYTEGPGRIKTQKTINARGEIYEDLTYTYDMMGLLLAGDDSTPGGRGHRSYMFDPLYQLKACTATIENSSATQQYEYFNHLNITRFDEAESMFYYDDPLHPDRINGLSIAGTGRQNLSYDANGNLLALPQKAFVYNEKNELVRFTSTEGVVADYGYDHHGMRVSKTVRDNHGSSAQTFFVGLDVEIRNSFPAYFVRLGDRRVGIIYHGRTSFVHTDYTGSTSFFTDIGGLKIAAIAYRPFGNLNQSSGVIDFRTFSIHPFDQESGLYYLKRRYYAPDIARFLTPDPLALYQPQKLLGRPKALHPYIFVGNDPLNNIDYNGLSFWSVVGATFGVVLAIGIATAAVFTGGWAGLLLGALMYAGWVSVSYVVASANRGTGLGEFFRGLMIGLNAGFNAMLGAMVFGPVIGAALGVINFLAAFDTIAGSKVYQGILGYSSWLMPMSWLATGVGLAAFVITTIVASGVFNVKYDKVSINWETGSIVTTGGFIHPAGIATGFNLGNFIFLKPGSSVRGA